MGGAAGRVAVCVADHDWSKAGYVGLLAGAAWFAGFAAPVEQIYPVLTPYVELADGRTVVATDGADVIEPSADGLSLRVRWNKWAVVGTPSGKVQDVGLVSEVVWAIENGTLTREETLSSKQGLLVFVAGGWLCRAHTIRLQPM